MTANIIDLRSDTLTKPTGAMRSAMAAAEVGDDAIDVDPTVQRLENRVAELLGMEAAMFMPSGTMTNQVAIRILCAPGDEFLCEESSHIYNLQQGGFAQLSGVVGRTVRGQNGVLRVDDVVDMVRPESDHMVRTRLLCLENTHNRASGCIQPFPIVEEITAWARAAGLSTHLDGARLFNAVVATGIAADRWARHFDTVSVCFSKGLGAPVGSALVGRRGHIAEARRHRKLFGGGMRQAGIVAAGALFGLENNIERLAEDHAHAQVIATAVRKIAGLELADDNVATNIVIFSPQSLGLSAAEFAGKMRERGVSLSVVGRAAVRAVTHLDVNEADVHQAARVMQELVAELR
jgi:threonine aldolase